MVKKSFNRSKFYRFIQRCFCRERCSAEYKKSNGIDRYFGGKMKVAVLFSGGKDSTYSVFWSLTQGFEPILITVKAEAYSMMFHHPNIDKTKLQAKAIGTEQNRFETLRKRPKQSK